MKSLRAGVVAVGLIGAVFCGSAQAAPQFYNWYLNFNLGPLSGQQVRGTLSVDGCGPFCTGNFTAPPPATSMPLLSLNITIDGVAFTLANDTGFGSGFPDVTFGPTGLLTGVDYQGVVTSGGKPFVLDTSNANVGELVAFYQGTLGSPVFGTRSLATLAAPEPGTLSLLGVALIGIVFALRRRASNGAARLVA